MLDRRQFLVASSAFGLATAVPGLARAELWTTQPVMFINPFAAGSAVDVVARLVVDNMAQRLGAPFRVENRTGASGVIGTEAVLKAGADGQTFLVGSSGSMGINPFLIDNIPYDAEKDFIPLSHVVSFPQAICVSPKLGVKSLEELIEMAKAQPGRLRFGSAGKGSTSHLTMELVTAEAGVEMIHVPYQGGSLVIQALLSGEIDVGTEGLPGLPGHIESGSVVPLAVTSEQRSPKYPDVRAVAETLPGFDTAAWVIFFAPAGTDDAIVQTLSDELRKSANDPQVKAKLEEIGTVVLDRSQQETLEFHRAELKKWARAVEIAKAKG